VVAGRVEVVVVEGGKEVVLSVGVIVVYVIVVVAVV